MISLIKVHMLKVNPFDLKGFVSIFSTPTIDIRSYRPMKSGGTF